MTSMCGTDCCDRCERRTACGGCVQTDGHPFGGTCIAAKSIRRGGKAEFQGLKNALIAEFNALGIPGLKLLYKVNPEADTYLVQRDIQTVTRSILFGGFADGLCVSGAAAGSEPDDVLLEKVWQVARPRGVPVFCNTGCRHENVRDKLQRCDAVCMGTAFKKDGVFDGRVDRARVESFMDIVRDIRAGL